MNKLFDYAKEFKIELTDNMLQQFSIYTDFLLEYNEKVNLTAITAPSDIAIKHYLDSIVLLSILDIKEDATLIDIGTGAGFPGIPLKIVRPDIKLSLLDSLNKRITFLDLLSEKLAITCKTIHARAEEAGREDMFREGYDIAVSRAVSSLPVLIEYCMPMVKVGGIFVAYKGPDIEAEIKSSKKAIHVLGAEVEAVHNITLPGENKRTFVVLRKTKETPLKYPRRGVKISKNPL